MEKKRLNATENNALLYLFGARKAMENAEPLGKRLKMLPRCWQMFKSTMGQIDKMIAQIELSMPREQMLSAERNRKTLDYHVGVKSPAGRTFENEGRWLSYDALDTLCEAAQAYCLTCTFDPQKQRSCRLAKALDELPCKNAVENAFGCRYIKGLY